MQPPVWEGIATQLTLLNHPHMAAFILVLSVTNMRPSELLALSEKDLAPLLGPLLSCWPIVIAASETGVSTKTGPRWVGPHKPALASMDQQDPARTQGRKFGG